MRLEFTQGENHKWWVLGTVSIGVFMAVLDSNIVNIALPSVMTSFRTDLITVEWVVLAYLLTISVMLLPMGRLADIVGRKKVYRAGFGVFILGSALCGVAPGVGWLIAARMIQALGASMTMANGLAITTAIFPARQRGQALGLNSTTVAVGATLGPTLGGLLVDALGWRSIFYLNLPVGLIGMAMAHLVLREELVTTTGDKRPSFDWPGAVTSAVTLGAFILTMSRAEVWGWAALPTLALLSTAIVFFVAFIVVERRSADAMIDLAFFRNRAFAAGVGASLLTFLAMSSNQFLMPFFLQTVQGYQARQAGLMITPVAVMLAVMGPISGRLSDRFGARAFSSIGLGIVGLALLWLSFIPRDASYVQVLVALAMVGAGIGLFQSPNNSSVLSTVPRASYGTTAAFLNLTRNTGQVTGIAVAGTIVTIVMGGAMESLASGAPASASQVQPFLDGMHAAYLAGAAFAFAGCLASLVRGPRLAPVEDAPALGGSPVVGSRPSRPC
ncbi:MAG: MFS transporter [Dehalococcoidia bacterium]|nr:MFS transporter [Dehalococcoidia bacterium]